MARGSKDKIRRGILLGMGFIVFGVLGAIVGYVQDKGSFDYLRMSLAMDYAILHLVLWTIVGVILILWHNRPPADELPIDRRDDNRDGVR